MLTICKQVTSPNDIIIRTMKASRISPAAQGSHLQEQKYNKII